MDSVLASSITRFVQEHGFETSDCIGVPLGSLHPEGCVGILYDDPRRVLVGPGYFNRIFIGVIWYNSLRRRASESRYVFEIHGKEYLPLCIDLAGKLARTAGTPVYCVPYCNELRFEQDMNEADFE